MSKLISGKEALIALANGEEVQAKAKNYTSWSACVKFWTVNEIMSYGGEFRLKPKTITLNGTELDQPKHNISANTNHLIFEFDSESERNVFLNTLLNKHF